MRIKHYSFKIDGIVWKFFTTAGSWTLFSGFKIDGIVWKLNIGEVISIVMMRL